MRNPSSYNPDSNVAGAGPRDLLNNALEARHIAKDELTADKHNYIQNNIGTPIAIDFPITAGAEEVEIFNGNAPFKFEILDVIVQSRATVAGGKLKLTNGTNDITGLINCSIDKAKNRVNSIDNDYSIIAKNGSLKLALSASLPIGVTDDINLCSGYAGFAENYESFQIAGISAQFSGLVPAIGLTGMQIADRFSGVFANYLGVPGDNKIFSESPDQIITSGGIKFLALGGTEWGSTLASFADVPSGPYTYNIPLFGGGTKEIKFAFDRTLWFNAVQGTDIEIRIDKAGCVWKQNFNLGGGGSGDGDAGDGDGGGGSSPSSFICGPDTELTGESGGDVSNIKGLVTIIAAKIKE